jgi:hypothetical protein
MAAVFHKRQNVTAFNDIGFLLAAALFAVVFFYYLAPFLRML